MQWYKFWVNGVSPFDCVYAQAENIPTQGSLKVFNAFIVQPSEQGMGVVPLTKNAQGPGMMFSTADNFLYINPIMWAPVDENDDQFRSIAAKLVSGIEIATKKGIILGK